MPDSTSTITAILPDDITVAAAEGGDSDSTLVRTSSGDTVAAAGATYHGAMAKVAASDVVAAAGATYVATLAGAGAPDVAAASGAAHSAIPGSHYVDRTNAVAAGTGTTIVKASPGRLRQVVVIATGTGSGTPVKFYDNASAGVGIVIAAVAADAAVGSVYPFQMPASLGITAIGVTNGPRLCASFD